MWSVTLRLFCSSFALLVFSTNAKAVDLFYEPTPGAGNDDWAHSPNWCPTIGPCGLFGTPDFGDHAILRQAFSGLTLESNMVGETTDMTVSNYSGVTAQGFLTVLGTLNIYGDSSVSTINLSYFDGGGNLVELGRTEVGNLVIGGAVGKGTFFLGGFLPGSSTLRSGTLVSGNEFIPGGTVTIGAFGDGAFAHRVGTHTIWGDLRIGVGPQGFQPEYQFEEGSLRAINQYIGYQGNGVFTHLNQATNTVTDSLVVGFEAANEGLRGRYVLDVDDPGFLEVGDDVAIGFGGVGEFDHQSGRHSITDDLFLGFELGSEGFYYLRSGSLSSVDQVIGLNGSGIFDQLGSSNALSGSMILGAQAESYGDYSMEPNPNNDGNDRFARLSSVNLDIAANGTGRFVNKATSTHSLSGTLTIAEFATGLGVYELLGGTLNSAGQVIGGAGVGFFTQISGTNTVAGSIVIGNTGGSSTESKYDLRGGEVSSQSITVNNNVQKAVFAHSGAATNTTGVLSLAVTGGEGIYQLNGGRLNAGSITSGSGAGRFELNSGVLAVDGPIVLNEFFVGTNGMAGRVNRSGNTTVNQELRLGDSAGSVGRYTATGGTLLAANLTVGQNGEGEFTQRAPAVVDVAGEVILGYFTGGPKNIIYQLLGGTLRADTIIVNRCVESASMRQSGGQAVVNTLSMRPLADACGGTAQFTLSGGMLEVQSVSSSLEAEFEFQGGIFQVVTYSGDLLNQAGTLAPFENSSVTGSYTQQSAAALRIELPSAGSGSSMDVGTSATLGGILRGVGDSGGVNNVALGRSFDILTAEEIVGDFSGVDLPQLESGYYWQQEILVDEVGSTDIYRLTVAYSPPLSDLIFRDSFE